MVLTRCRYECLDGLTGNHIKFRFLKWRAIYWYIGGHFIEVTWSTIVIPNLSHWNLKNTFNLIVIFFVNCTLFRHVEEQIGLLYLYGNNIKIASTMPRWCKSWDAKVVNYHLNSLNISAGIRKTQHAWCDHNENMLRDEKYLILNYIPKYEHIIELY